MTFKPARLLVALLSVVVLPVFAAPAATAQNIATVNGKGIPSSRADFFVKQAIAQSQGQQADSPELREKIKKDLIGREVLVQEADKLGLGKSTDVKNEIEIARQSIVVRALVLDFVKKNPVADAEIKTEYDKLKAEAGDKEYRARHILVDKEDEAKAIIAKLKGGSKFEDLAKQSKDPGSAEKGGDLDWATPGNYVKPFSAAMVALKKGEVTDTPVRSEFGYHVIKLEDVRAYNFPALDSVKPKLNEMLQQKKLQAYHDDLVKKAKVQ
jgi:peptidyl-prolyl cis-trans isomerase C